MEMLLTIMCYGFQLVCILLLSGAVCAVVVGVLSLFGVKTTKKHKILAFAVCLLMVSSLLIYTAYHPAVYYPEEYDAQVTDELKTDIKSIVSGIYSKNVPLLPIYIVIESVDDNTVKFKTVYLFFGSTVHEIGDDGICLIKPLYRQR